MARIPGPECGHSKPCFIDPGTMCRSQSPFTSPVGCHPLQQGARQPAPVANDPFSGATPYDQALSLLRPVLPYGHYGRPLKELPQPLSTLVGKKVNIGADLVLNYLAKERILESHIGGSLATSLPYARYFVIHDTSSKVPHGKSFPRDINEWSWPNNQLSKELRQRLDDAHVFVTRVGTSFTAHDFSQPYSATKYTIKYRHKKNQFLHTELIQPRLPDRRGIDAIAPKPGFPESQLRRLAVIYIAASLRHGVWLVPAFHAVVDYEFRNNPRMHDDPQNFNLDTWAEQLGALLKAIHGVRPAGEDKVTGIAAKA